LKIVEPRTQVKRRPAWNIDPPLSVSCRLSWPAAALLALCVAAVNPAAARSDEPNSEEPSKSTAKKTDLVEDASTIRGTVTDENGAAAEGVRVFVDWPQKEGGQAETRTDGKGQFELAIPSEALPGVLVRASTESGQFQAHYEKPWEPKPGRLDDVRLKLSPARRVELRVVDGAQRPIAEAKAGILADYHCFGTGRTDADGKAVFLVPRDVENTYVFALKDGHGLDYRAYVVQREQMRDKKAVAPALPDGIVQLTLDGAKPLRVHTVTADGKPIAGIKLYPWLLKKPDQPEDLNLSFLTDVLQATSDGDGFARFDWIPHWHDKSLTFWSSSEDYLHQRGEYDPKTGDGTLTVQLQRPVPLRGRVTLSNGSPAADIEIVASGEGYEDMDGFRGTAKTDALGRYEIQAAPNMVYLVVVQDKKWASQPRPGFVVWPDTPVENLDFKLRFATQIFGRVTRGTDQQPVKGEQIVVYQYGQQASEIKEAGPLDPKKGNRSVLPTIVQDASTDDEGNYKLFVGPGKFDIRGPGEGDAKEFEITTESQQEFNFHTKRPENGILSGRIVTGDPPRGLAGATIEGIYRRGLQGADIQATTDAEGNFEVECDFYLVAIIARSKDGTLAAAIEIQPEGQAVTIVVYPFATASGRLVDGTGKPLPGCKISTSGRVYLGDEDSPCRDLNVRETIVTDENGVFKLKRLIVGQQYEIHAQVPDDGDPPKMYVNKVGNVRAAAARDVPLGDLKPLPPD
jgi:hypothetical protein